MQTIWWRSPKTRHTFTQLLTTSVDSTLQAQNLSQRSTGNIQRPMQKTKVLPIERCNHKGYRNSVLQANCHLKTLSIRSIPGRLHVINDQKCWNSWDAHESDALRPDLATHAERMQRISVKLTTSTASFFEQVTIEYEKPPMLYHGTTAPLVDKIYSYSRLTCKQKRQVYLDQNCSLSHNNWTNTTSVLMSVTTWVCDVHSDTSFVFIWIR